MGPLSALKSVFGKAFTFSGRACRAEYWWFFGTYLVVTCLLFAVDAALIYQAMMRGAAAQLSPFDSLTLYWVLLTVIPHISLTVRRLHDIGKSGFWFLLYFVPLIGGLIVFIMTLLPSENRTNIFGAPPHGGMPRRQQPGLVPGQRTDEAAHDPMQGYAVLMQGDTTPTPEMIAARKAEVRALYEERVLGRARPA